MGRSRPVRFERFGGAVVLFRDAEGTARALDDRCPHRGASLAAGRVVGGCIECPFHGFQFDGDGTCTVLPAHGDEPIPAAMRAPAYATKEAHGLIWMWRGDGDPVGEPSFFDVLADGFSYAELTSRWHTHYTRAVENQLDFTHLPFVHRTSIGRGMAPRVEVEMDVSPSHIRAWLAGNGPKVAVEWRAPNVWTLELSPTLVQFLAFIPVDETHTDLLCRAYQRQVRIPGIRALYDWVSVQTNRWILGQDQAVVETQRPYEAQLGMAELLVPSDSPITEYRRIRHRASKTKKRLDVAV
ncbi:MAG: aromatic ring-hydroxylating dioxygenase subunit alpha [Myxococcales bacterium]|nr:aromatic ring-hydroxylating dioxygenase subunit alpha [Myxococcales bacterium]